MVEVIHSAFSARPPVNPPSAAIDETAETLAATLRRGTGIFARVGDRPAGVIIVLPGVDRETWLVVTGAVYWIAAVALVVWARTRPSFRAGGAT